MDILLTTSGGNCGEGLSEYQKVKELLLPKLFRNGQIRSNRMC